MRKLLLLALLSWRVVLAQPALVADASSNGSFTSAINTTGANLIVVSVSTQDSYATVSDSKGNNYTLLLSQVSNDGANRLLFYYCLNPTVGSGHTFSNNASYGVHDIVVQAFSGVQGL